MTFRENVLSFVIAVAEEAEKRGPWTLTGDVELSIPGDPNVPVLRFGAGNHDWRNAHLITTNEGGDPVKEELNIHEAVRKWTDMVVGEEPVDLQVKAVEERRERARRTLERLDAERLRSIKELGPAAAGVHTLEHSNTLLKPTSPTE